MSKLITGTRVNPERAEVLREKVIEIIKKEGVIVRESQIVNFLIDEFASKISHDKEGFYIDEDL